MLVTKEIETNIKKLYLYGFTNIEIARTLGISNAVSVKNIVRDRKWNFNLRGCRTCLYFGKDHKKCSRCSCLIHTESEIKDIQHFPDHKHWTNDIRKKRVGIYQVIEKKRVCHSCLTWDRNKKAQLFEY